MSIKIPVSVFIIAKNEADRIPHTIKSVINWTDEVIVIDSGSDDDTVKTSEQLGARVVYNKWPGYGPQKVFGEGLCKNDWLLNLDADEEITPELRDEIIALFEKGEPEHKAYSFRITMLSRFDDRPGRFAPCHNQIRLYNKKYAGFKDSTVHDSVIIKQEGYQSKSLKNITLHRSFRSFSHAIGKINFYSSMQAEDMVKRGRKPSAIRIISEPITAFFKAYFGKRYCLIGIDGFIESFIYAFARVIRLAKAREMWREKGKIS